MQTLTSNASNDNKNQKNRYQICFSITIMDRSIH